MAKTTKVSSITRKVQWQLIKAKLGILLSSDILLLLTLTVSFLGMQEMAVFGNISFYRDRQIVYPDFQFSKIYYIVRDDGIERLRIKLAEPLQNIFIIIGVLFLIQILFHLLFGTWIKRNRIKNILSPIDDIALKADKISRMTFDERKFTELENAIDHIMPDDEGLLNLGDADLAGIEAAMNNLLIRMRETNRQQARFVNDASHELRTPIAVIQGYANMLARWGKDDEKVLDESIRAITHEADHMNKLVEQLLFLARGDSGRTKLNIEIISLNELMQEIYEESFMIDEEHPYRFQNASSEISLPADSTLLKQAVRILIDNAAKYTKKGDEIFLQIGTTDENHPYIQIQDTGIGMAQEDVVHMFDRFYRSDEVRNYDGTGLGLSIAKWIIDMHRGYFEILSRAELGTRVKIILP